MQLYAYKYQHYFHTYIMVYISIKVNINHNFHIFSYECSLAHHIFCGKFAYIHTFFCNKLMCVCSSLTYLPYIGIYKLSTYLSHRYIHRYQHSIYRYINIFIYLCIHTYILQCYIYYILARQDLFETHHAREKADAIHTALGMLRAAAIYILAPAKKLICPNLRGKQACRFFNLIHQLSSDLISQQFNVLK